MLLIAVIAAITLASLGVSDMRDGRKRAGVWKVVGGFLVVAVPVGSVAAWNAYQEWASWEHTVAVQGFEAGGELEFTLDIRHQADSIIYTDDSEREEAQAYMFTYSLSEAGDAETVSAVFQEQHPQGVRATTEFGHGDLASVWHVYGDGARYDLFDQLDGSFVVATQVARVSADEDPEPAFIPFPSGSSPHPLTPEITTYLTDLSMAEWVEFYTPIDGVHITGNSIAIPTSRSGTATLNFAEDPDGLGLGFTVTVSD